MSKKTETETEKPNKLRIALAVLQCIAFVAVLVFVVPIAFLIWLVSTNES